MKTNTQILFLVTLPDLAFSNKTLEFATFTIALIITVGQTGVVCHLPSSLFRASDCVSVHCALAKVARATGGTARPKIKQPPSNLAFVEKTNAMAIWFSFP